MRSLSKTYKRQDGSEVKITAVDESWGDAAPHISVAVARRASEKDEWVVCSKAPHPNWREMSVAEYVAGGRSEALKFAKIIEILAVVNELLEREKNAEPEVPPFMPYWDGDVYDDYRVVGTVSHSRVPDGVALAIHEWTSKYPNQGHTVQALKWLRARSVVHVEAHGVGTLDMVGGQLVPDISTLYWAHMIKKGLVDKMFDDNGAELVVLDDGSIDYAQEAQYPRQRA